MKQATKKEFHKHSKRYSREHGHWEGRYWCDCMVRGYRLWLAKKLYGTKDIDDLNEDENLQKESYEAF